MFPRFEAPGHLDIFPGKIARGNTERVVDRAVDVHRVVMQFEFSVRDPGQVEQIVDEQRFELDVALEHFEIAAEIVAQVRLAPERRDRHEHRSERRAQLVREHGEELVFRLVGFFRFALRALQKDFGVLRVGDVEHRSDESRHFARTHRGRRGRARPPSVLCRPAVRSSRYSISKRPVLPGCRTRWTVSWTMWRSSGMHPGEIGFVGDFRFRRNAKQFPAPLGELQLARLRKEIERSDVGRFGGEPQAVLALFQFGFAFVRQLLLFFSLGDIGPENDDPVLGRIHPRVEPAIPGRIKKFAVARLACLHDMLAALVEFRADRFGKNFPDDASDHFFLRPAGQLGDLVVHVRVAPIAIERREGVADAGENGLAFLDQIAHGKLVAARAQRRLDRADQGEAAQGARNERQIRIRAQQIEDAMVRIVRLASARQNEQRQIGPRRLRAQVFQEPRNLRAGKASSARSTAPV